MYINLKLGEALIQHLEAGKTSVGIKGNSDYIRYLIVKNGFKVSQPKD